MTVHRTTLVPGQGRLLVATPVIEEPIFFRTVILLLEHDDDVGSLGVVLNRPGEVRVSEAIPQWAEVAGAGAVLFEGGPVAQNTALALAALPSDHAAGSSPTGSGGLSATAWKEHGLTPLFDGLAVVDLDQDPLPGASGESFGPVRFYHGYAGWGPGQLRDELRGNAWWVLASTQADWFSASPARLWGEVLARQGGSWTMWANAPEDPSVN